MAEPVYGLKKDDVRRIGEVLDRIETDPRFVVAPTDGSSNARDPVQHWCKITSTSTTAGRYPGTRYRYDAAAATWTAFESIWIVTPNGETLSSTSTYYRCNAEGFANGRMVFLAVVPATVSGSLTVEEADGSPSYASITTLRLDQADGFVVTNPSAGVARIDIAAAGASTVGVVTTGTQTIAGVKTFQDGIEVDVDLYVSGTSTFDDTLTLNGADLVSSGDLFEMQSATATVDFTNIAAFLLPQAPPANSSDTGTTGQFTFDSSYLYIATGTNTWKRVALSSF